MGSFFSVEVKMQELNADLQIAGEGSEFHFHFLSFFTVCSTHFSDVLEILALASFTIAGVTAFVLIISYSIYPSTSEGLFTKRAMWVMSALACSIDSLYLLLLWPYFLNYGKQGPRDAVGYFIQAILLLSDRLPTCLVFICQNII